MPTTKLTPTQQRILQEVAAAPPHGAMYDGRFGRSIQALSRQGLVDYRFLNYAKECWIVQPTDAGRHYVKPQGATMRMSTRGRFAEIRS